jgi:hypothetical protein
MLTPNELKPHILDEDRWIRSAAIDRFTDSWSPDPEIAALALTAHERYFKRGDFPCLSGLDQLSIDARTATRVLALLDATPSRLVTIHLNWCLASLPLEILRAEGSRIDDHPRLDDETREKIRYHRKIGDLSDESLWEEFLRFTGRAKMRRVPSRLDPHTRGLVDELASRKLPDDESVCSWLRSPAFRGTHFEALLVKLAGVRRLKAAVPCLVAMLGQEGEEIRPSFLLEALVRIGGSDPVRAICKRWRHLRHDGRDDAAHVLGLIPIPESEEALVEFFEEGNDPDVRFTIAGALCNLFSSRAVEHVLGVLREEPSLEEDLREKILPVIDLLKIEVPEARSWRKERQEKLARQPSAEEFSPEALEIHEKILGAIEQMDQAAELCDDVYRELERRLAEPEGEEEEGSRPTM